MKIMLILLLIIVPYSSSNLVFHTNLHDVHLYNGKSQNVNVLCDVTGAGDITYSWFKGENSNPRNERWNADGAHLLYSNVKIYDNETVITCEAYSSYLLQTIRESFTLYVYDRDTASPPVIIQEPTGGVTDAYQSYQFTCKARGISGKIFWMKDNENISNLTSPNIQITYPATNTDILITSLLTITNLTYSDTGDYQCVTKGLYRFIKGENNATAILKVKQSPRFVERPAELTSVILNHSVNLSCKAEGYPMPKVWWLDSSGSIVNSGEVWPIPDPGLDLTGGYRCRANTTNHSVVTDEFYIDVIYKPILLEELPYMLNKTVENELILNCNFSGNPQPDIKWYKDGIQIINSSPVSIIETELLIGGLTKSDAGAYYCVAYNDAGNTTSNMVTVVIQDLPSPPTNLSIDHITNTSASLYWGNITAAPEVYQYVFTITNMNTNVSLKKIVPKSDILRSDTGYNQYIIDGLTPFINYSVIFNAVNSIGYSLTAQYDIFQTDYGIPATPRDIKVKLEDPQTIQISWNVSANSIYGDIYTILINITSLQNASLTELYSVAENYSAYKITNLKPYHRYFIQMRVSNIQFNSDYSETYFFTTLQAKPDTPPSSLSVKCTAPTSCKLTWEPPINPNGIISFYTLIVNNLLNNETVLIAQELPSKSTFQSLQQLNPYTHYEISLRASTIAGSGPPAMFNFMTPEGRPETYPILSILSISSNEIHITWNSLTRDQLNGKFKRYQLRYTYSTTKYFPDNLFDYAFSPNNINLTNNSYKLSDLVAYTNYRLSIRVFAGAGYGPYTATPISVITYTAKPTSYPAHIRAVTNSHTSIHLSWDNIPYTQINSPVAVYAIAYSTSHSNDWKQAREVYYPHNSLLVSDLLPNMEYKFKIRVSNANGSSEYSKEVSNSTFDELFNTLQVTASLVTPLKIHLLISPLNYTGIATDYTLDVYTLKAFEELVESVIITSNESPAHYFYNATQYYTLYKFRISTPHSNYSYAFVTTMETTPSASPKHITAFSDTSTSINLAWFPISQKSINGNLTAYSIRYKAVNTAMWNFKDILPAFFHILTGLDKYTTYEVSVAGITTAVGIFSDASFSTTLPALPYNDIQNIRFEDKTHNSFLIRWGEPLHPNGIISGYNIKIERISDYLTTFDSVVYSSNLNEFYSRELKPFTLYQVSIAAKNQLGIGKYSQAEHIKTSEFTPDPPDDLHHISYTSSVEFYWRTPENPNGLLIDYTLTLINTQTKTVLVKTALAIINRQRYSKTFDDLEANTSYSISILTRNYYSNSTKRSTAFITDYLHPSLSDTSDISIIVDDTESYMTAKLPMFDDNDGQISYYLVVLVAFNPEYTHPDNISTISAIDNIHPYAATDGNYSAGAYYYIAANVSIEEYGSFSIGDNTAYGDYRNTALTPGASYRLYVIAVAPSRFNGRTLSTASTLSRVFSITDTPEASSSAPLLILIACCVAVSVLILLALILVLICLVSCYYFRFRQKVPSESIPYKQYAANSELTNVPWTVNLTSKKLSKNSDPISNYRNMSSSDPELDARPPIPPYMLPKLLENLLSDNQFRLTSEYNSLNVVQCDESSTNNAVMEMNATKNRYLNILPYDYNRVVLQQSPAMKEFDYINASYIDGSRRKSEYIATQGPTDSTLQDFWRMIWDQQVVGIVMITKLVEKNISKCTQYWPIRGNQVYGKIKVTLASSTAHCDFIVRQLSVSRVGCKDTRRIYHFQYTSWPDHGVPEHPLPMIKFLGRVQQTLSSIDTSTTQPLLVHCSAGVGRTGTFIVLDSMMSRIKNHNNVDIYGNVSYLRTQRMFMVQGEDQYLFIYRALVEAITSQRTAIPLTYVEYTTKLLSEIAPCDNNAATGYVIEFNGMNNNNNNNNFNNNKGKELGEGNQSYNRTKNRYASIVPYDAMRVALPLVNNELGSDYINASFVDGPLYKQQYIATQNPLQNTINDYWRMVWKYNCPIIVMLDGEAGLQIEQQKGIIEVCKISERETREYRCSQYTLYNMECNETRTASLYHILTPNEGDFAHTLTLFCQELQSICSCITLPQKGPMLVQCRSGSGMSGVFIAVTILLDEIRYFTTFNVLQTVEYLRLQRPCMVETAEQYQLIYESILQYSKMNNSFCIINANECNNEETTTSSSNNTSSSSNSNIDSVKRDNRSQASSWCHKNITEQSNHSNRPYSDNYRNSILSNNCSLNGDN